MTKTTPLAKFHNDLGAKMAPFAGWEMPIQYEGIVAEHKAVRSGVGVFDISHMGQFLVSGKGTIAGLNRLLTNDCAALSDQEGQYTLMLNEAGGVIDDLIIYRELAEEFFLVVNASKIEEDFDWMKSNLPGDCELEDQSANFGGLAVQGPQTKDLWDKINPDAPLPERNGIVRYGSLILCGTGYTGEEGFELFAPSDEIGEWFEQLLEAGATPCGLGARDTLRLEKCYPLNGSDLSPEHTPLEAGLGFFVKLNKESDFIGKETLKKQKKEGLQRKLVALKIVGKAPPPRPHYEVVETDSETVIGELSSGTLSPSLGEGIAMAYLPIAHTKVGSKVEIQIRARRFPAEVIKKPFL